MTVPEFIAARRSIRAFDTTPIRPELLDTCIEAACLAPAPHHSRPWRWVTITNDESKAALANGMGAHWREDLRNDGVGPDRIDKLVRASFDRLVAAPALVVGCLTNDGLDHYPDARRQRAEYGMALLSLGAAVENLMLCAADLGLASCWVAAPIFCPEAARDALALDATWLPHALVCLGYAHPTYEPRVRPQIDLSALHAPR